MIKKTIMALLAFVPMLTVAAPSLQEAAMNTMLEAEGTGFICLSTDAADQVNDSLQLVSDVRSVNPTVFVFDPKRYTWAAYRDGRLVRSGRASGGANYCKDVGRSCRTPRGKFRVYSLGSEDCKSGKYPKPNGGAAMPHCMFFHGGYAIHGSPHVPLDNASHGCIRVTPKDASWLRKSFIKVGTEVVVRPY
jgi:hypothetical protein